MQLQEVCFKAGCEVLRMRAVVIGDTFEMSVNIPIFNKQQFEYATYEYLKLERTNKENENAVVLVSASSLQTLKKAYPSYFLDNSEFISAIEKMNYNCKELKIV